MLRYLYIAVIFFLFVVVFLFACKTSKVSTARMVQHYKDITSLPQKVSRITARGTQSTSFNLVEPSSLQQIEGLVITNSKFPNARWVREIKGAIDVTEIGIDNTGNSLIDTSMQKVIDYLVTTPQKKLFFPKGQYQVGQLDVPAGFHFIGETGTEFLKKPNSGKFSRMITSVNHTYSGKVDSEPLVIENISFDGRSHLQGLYEKYQLEQQAMIFLHAKSEGGGRLNAEIRNCTFKNGVGDAIGVYVNVDVRIENITAENVFRGAITATGGNTRVVAKNIRAFGKVHKTGIDIEIDASGFGKSKFIYFEAKDVYLAGDFDIGLSDGEVWMKNVISEDVPFNVYAPNAKIRIEDSKFTFKSSTTGHIYFPKDVVFSNTEFNYEVGESDTSFTIPINILWNTSYRESYNLALTFNNCNFVSKGKKVIGLYNSADFAPNNNVLKLNDCTFAGNFLANIDYHFGGTIDVEDTYFDGDKGLVLRSLDAKTPYSYKATLKGIRCSGKMTEAVQYQESSSNTIILKDKSKNVRMQSFGQKKSSKTTIKIND